MSLPSDNKQKIIDESLRLFSLKGFLGTSIQDIMEATHISKGGLYNYFKSKDEILSAVLSEARKIWRQRTLYGLDGIDKPVQKVKKLIKNYKDRYLADTKTFPGGCIFITLSVELDDQLPSVAKELNEGFSRLKAMIKRYLEEGKKTGELKAAVDTDALTEMIFTCMLGASVLYSIEKHSQNRDIQDNMRIGKYFEVLSNYLDSLTP